MFENQKSIGWKITKYPISIIKLSKKKNHRLLGWCYPHGQKKQQRLIIFKLCKIILH